MHKPIRTDGADYWDAEADAYAAGRAPSAVDAATLALVPPRGDVLELGAGPGVVSRQILGFNPTSMTLTDVSPAFCAKLEALPARVMCVDHRALKLHDQSLDVIYAMATLHHLRAAERKPVLAAARRWLRPEGRFVLVEDWAFTPRNETQRRLFRLRAALRVHQDPDELHPDVATWTRLAVEVGFHRIAAAEAPRPERLDRYAVLRGDPIATADLDWLSSHDPEPEVPMSILVFG